MRSFLIAAAFGLGLLGASVATAGPAMAEGKDDRGNYGGAKFNYFGALLYGAPRHDYRPRYRRSGHDFRRKHHHVRRHHHRERYVYSAPRRAYGWRRMDYRVIRPCRVTSKIGFAHGRRARIGGTMCYDTYGTPYIVQGSRYIIQYF